jgi:ubiquinone/menaquinone biosynthesis C-methylase UbiE
LENSKSGEQNMDDLAGTYFVQDRSNRDELQRLIVQERMVTETMGGVLPEQSDPTQFHRVLDIGCGPGGWIIATAEAYPQIEKLYGIDISPTMIGYARQQAEQHHIKTGPKERVEFLVMDALLVLEFPHEFFDLVNFRLGVSFMRQWDWPKLFSEMHRVLKPRGTARIVDVEINIESTSTALSTFWAAMRCALTRSGHLFEETPTGLVDHLPTLLQRHEFHNIQSYITPVEHRALTAAGQALLEDHIHGFRSLPPFLSRYGCLPPDYDVLCQQVIQDMQQAGFVARTIYHTFCATNPIQRQVGSVAREMPS